MILISPAAISGGAHLFPHSLHFADRSWDDFSCFLLWLLNTNSSTLFSKILLFSNVCQLLLSSFALSALIFQLHSNKVLASALKISSSHQVSLGAFKINAMAHHNTIYIHQDRLYYKLQSPKS